MSDLTAADAARLLAEATPGPWYIDAVGSRCEVHSNAAYPGDPGDDGEGWTVAEACGHPIWEQADARLIAAAPDLARAVIRLEAERDAYKRAKAENDDRFMLERDVARAEVEQLRAIVAAESGEAGPPGWEWFDGYWRRDLPDNRQLRVSRANGGGWYAVVEEADTWGVRVLPDIHRWALDAMAAADAEAKR